MATSKYVYEMNSSCFLSLRGIGYNVFFIFKKIYNIINSLLR